MVCLFLCSICFQACCIRTDKGCLSECAYGAGGGGSGFALGYGMCTPRTGRRYCNGCFCSCPGRVLFLPKRGFVFFVVLSRVVALIMCTFFLWVRVFLCVRREYLFFSAEASCRFTVGFRRIARVVGVVCILNLAFVHQIWGFPWRRHIFVPAHAFVCGRGLSVVRIIGSSRESCLERW